MQIDVYRQNLPGADLGKRSNAKRLLASVKSHVDSDDSAWLRIWVAGQAPQRGLASVPAVGCQPSGQPVCPGPAGLGQKWSRTVLSGSSPRGEKPGQGQPLGCSKQENPGAGGPAGRERAGS